MRRVCALALAALALLPIRRPLRATSRSCCTRPASRRRSPSCRIRPIARCSSSSSRADASAWCRTARCCRTEFLESAAARSSSGGERGLLGMAFAPDYASSGRFFVNFTNTAGHTVVARFRRSADPLVADPSIAVRSALERRGRPGLHRAAVRQPQRRQPGVRSRRLSLHRHGRRRRPATIPDNRAQNPTELLGKMLRIDVNVPDDDAIGYRCRPNNPFVSGGPAGARPEIWAFGLRNPWRYSFDDPARGGTGALVIGDVGQNAGRRSTTSRPTAAAATTAGATAKATHDNVTSRRRRISRSDRSDPRIRPLRRPVDHRRLRLSRRARSARRTGAAISSPTSSQGASGRSALVDRRRPVRRTATDADRAHRRTGAAGALGNISSFGVDADGELLIVSYSRGAILKLVSAAPATPTGLRIIRP